LALALDLGRRCCRRCTDWDSKEKCSRRLAGTASLMERGSEKGRDENRRGRRVEIWLELTGRLDGGSRTKEDSLAQLRRRFNDDKLTH
jgi:hypothetical protein